MIDACATLLQGFALDWQATVRLLQTPGLRELNPLIRVIGPDAYFAPIILWTARHCSSDIPWWVTVGQWAATTWAMNTHLAFGTGAAVPWLVFHF